MYDYKDEKLYSIFNQFDYRLYSSTQYINQLYFKHHIKYIIYKYHPYIHKTNHRIEIENQTLNLNWRIKIENAIDKL